MEVKKVFVQEGYMAIITCPNCRRTKKMSVADYVGKRKRNLRIKCTCMSIFCLCLENRRHPRKSVKILGKSINLSRHRKGQDIIIKNISYGGVGCSTFYSHRARKEDYLLVLFNLNDVNMTPIEANATVRNVSPEFLNCEFHSGQNFMTSLGFYLLG